MGRAELRRAEREKRKSETVTYNLTRAQLDAFVQEQIGYRIKEAKEEATSEAINQAIALLLTLPLEVLMDHYWPKSYAKRLPGFVDKVIEYYEMWQDGKLDMDKMKEDLWQYGGVRLEPEKVEG
ncbi:hypothetical protein [Blautia glucerasea]|uniref:hypothetical protein n=1 Tax=Blautia glucerasea TaxID=536633 RepID=UPI00157085FF|nr:hypothetical protein [Blautia glucerasea]NSJ25512.1 hypothetical protein [Blautia glucerasea]